MFEIAVIAIKSKDAEIWGTLKITQKLYVIVLSIVTMDSSASTLQP